MFVATDHAFERGAQRLPFQPDENDFDAAVQDIISHILGLPTAAPVLLLKRYSRGREEWATLMRGHAVRLIYEPLAAAVITVLR